MIPVELFMSILECRYQVDGGPGSKRLAPALCVIILGIGDWAMRGLVLDNINQGFPLNFRGQGKGESATHRGPESHCLHSSINSFSSNGMLSVPSLQTRWIQENQTKLANPTLRMDKHR